MEDVRNAEPESSRELQESMWNEVSAVCAGGAFDPNCESSDFLPSVRYCATFHSWASKSPNQTHRLNYVDCNDRQTPHCFVDMTIDACNEEQGQLDGIFELLPC